MYLDGTTLSDKRFADLVFKMNMYILIKHKSFFDPYSWNCLQKARKLLADIYFDVVSRFGEAAFLNKTV